MIDEKDFKLIPKKTPGHFRKAFKATCDGCGSDRGYVDKCDAAKLCRSCTRVKVHKDMNPIIKEKISKATSVQFKGHTPWNKDKTDVYSKELKEQWSKKHREINSSEEFRMKMSCSKRNISVDQFDGFSSDEQERVRSQIKSQGLSKQCFERDNYTCQKCLVRGTKLHAHHKNGFDLFPDQRFQLANLATLCVPCHDRFHMMYGKGRNTDKQYQSFLCAKKIVFLLAGPSGSGKSWVCDQLSTYSVIDLDKKNDLLSIIDTDKPLVSITVGVSTFIKNNPQFDCKLVLIKEQEGVLKSRLQARGGEFTRAIKKRIARFKKLESMAEHVGTSQEVLDFLTSQ